MFRHEIGDVLQQVIFLIRLAQIGVDSELHRVFAVLVGSARSDHDDRQVVRPGIAAHIALARSKPSMRGISMSSSITSGHEFLQFFQRIHTVLGGNHLVAVRAAAGAK